MTTTIKTIFESNNWMITNIMQGRNGLVRINAKTRNRIADGESFFSEWCSEKYANRLSSKKYGKKVHELNIYSY
jgi:hypothetical protein